MLLLNMGVDCVAIAGWLVGGGLFSCSVARLFLVLEKVDSRRGCCDEYFRGGEREVAFAEQGKYFSVNANGRVSDSE